MARWGSSPRMRGTRPESLAGRVGRGIIPAHAGNTKRLSTFSRRTGDHPRACGEHSMSLSRLMPWRGSSPRMRGTPLHDAYIGGFMGIIPAHAGNTRCETRCTAPRRDHPRACGEHLSGDAAAFDRQGSSPRMRGTRRSTSSTRSATRDHPRACGEHAVLAVREDEVSGSSPRMRGTLNCRNEWRACAGIIPAHAGNTGRSC